MSDRILDMARAERRAFLDLLGSLTPEQWRVESLCAGWTVHDVAVHVVADDDLSTRGFARRVLRSGFRPTRINAIGLEESRELTPEGVLALFRARTRPEGPATGLGGVVGLFDALVHQQDVRRPLGMPRAVPPEHLRIALRAALYGPAVRGITRAVGLRLVATDMDWSFGRGPEVRGTAEALLMTVAGRRGVVDELSGPGRPTLARRV